MQYQEAEKYLSSLFDQFCLEYEGLEEISNKPAEHTPEEWVRKLIEYLKNSNY